MEQPQQPQQPQFVQVDIRFLQALLDYLSTRPYSEVHQFIDVLIGKNKTQTNPQQHIDNNLTLSEDFDSDKNNGEES